MKQSLHSIFLPNTACLLLHSAEGHIGLHTHRGRLLVGSISASAYSVYENYSPLDGNMVLGQLFHQLTVGFTILLFLGHISIPQSNSE